MLYLGDNCDFSVQLSSIIYLEVLLILEYFKYHPQQNFVADVNP